MNLNLGLLLLGCAALLISVVMLPLPSRVRGAIFAIIVGSVLQGSAATTVTDDAALIVADAS